MKRSPRIIIIDDEVDLAENLRDIFEEEGYRVVVAYDGKNGVAFCGETMFELAFIDIKLPDMAGNEVAKKIVDLSPETECILITAHASLESAVEAVKQRGVIGYEIKPLDMDRVLTFVKEIFRRRRAEKAHVESEKRYREIAELLPDMIYELDTSLRLKYANRAFFDLLGYTEVDFLKGITLFDLVADKDFQKVQKVLAKVEKDKSNKLTEVALYRKNGTIIICEAASLAIRDNNGNMVGFRGTIHDITERKNLEAQFLHSQKMEAIGTLAGGVAHDFNNILTRIIVYCELILHKMKPDKPLRVKIESILEDGLRAEVLTRQLLTFSRKEFIQPCNININEITKNLTSMLIRLIGQGIKFETDLHPDVYPIRADPKQIEQIIINLAVNASDAMTDTGTLTIKTANITINESDIAGFSDITADDYVALSVQDTGCGISKENLAKIFEPFFTTKEVGKGTGLGLSTVYGIIKQNRGDIKITSEPDKGTTINIYLPRLKEEETAVITEAKEKEAQFPGGTETILLVEDDTGIRELISDLLRDLGYTVHEAENGMEALQVFGGKEKSIDLLLTDVIMPKMGGIKLAEEVMSVSSAVKVLFISGYIEKAFDRGNLEDERVAILRKPFNSSTLSRKIRDILDNPHKKKDYTIVK